MGGPLTFEEIFPIINKSRLYHDITNIVETGTYKGDTCIPLSQHFKNIYTIEIVPKLYEYTFNLAKEQNIKNINFYLGDTLEILKQIMPLIEGQKNIYFIDSHQSGPDTGNNKKQFVPLMEELKIILNFNLQPSVFIFDDLRFFKGKEQEAWDWKKEDITVVNILNEFYKKEIKIYSFFERDDRLWILTK